MLILEFKLEHNVHNLLYPIQSQVPTMSISGVSSLFTGYSSTGSSSVVNRLSTDSSLHMLVGQDEHHPSMSLDGTAADIMYIVFSLY